MSRLLLASALLASLAAHAAPPAAPSAIAEPRLQVIAHGALKASELRLNGQLQALKVGDADGGYTLLDSEAGVRAQPLPSQKTLLLPNWQLLTF